MTKKLLSSKVDLQIMEYFNLHNRWSVKTSSLKRKIFLVSVIFLSFAAEILGQQPATEKAEQRVRAYVAALNSNKPPEWRKFINENYTKSALERVPIDTRLGYFYRVYDETRGMNIQSISPSKPNEIVVIVKSNLTGDDYELIVQVEEQSPFLLNSIRYTPKPPVNKKMSEQEIVKELDNYLKKLADADVFSGAVLLACGNNILFEKAFSEANKDFKALNNVNTKFNLGSMNKMFTSVAIAQLVEAGKLSFDDPLGKFMPDFPSKEASEKIKIKHLLSHTSGLGSYFNQTFFDTSRTRFRSVDDFLELAKDEKMAFEPGSRWAYSNTGMLVLGKVIEKVSGQNYFDYIRKNIYKKAGMTSSDSYNLDGINPNLAVGYEKTYTEQGIVFGNNIFLHVIRGGPAGGGYSTIGDLFRFAKALREGKLISAENVKTMTTAKPELNSPDYGYGFIIDTNPETFGHSGGFLGISSELIMFANSDCTAVVLSNYGSGSQLVTEKIRRFIQLCADCQTAKN